MKNYVSHTIDFTMDPVVLLNEFVNEPYCFMLDSRLHASPAGRYSFIGFDPFKIYRHKANASLKDLQKEFMPFRFSSDSQHPLPAGIVGFLSYDHGLHQEKIPLQSQDDLNLPDCLFGFYDAMITVDHHLKKCHITSTGFPYTDLAKREQKAQERIEQISHRIQQLSSLSPVISKSKVDDPSSIDLTLKSNFTQADYYRTVEAALERIAIGDIYQVNLSQRFSLNVDSGRVDPFDVYCHLRHQSPTNFGVYFDAGEFKVLSNSPERFLKLKGRTLLTRPMKGTRPRGKTTEQDERLNREIIESRKDIAELLMITDLLRNDLGRVCEYGSVNVTDMRSIEKYATVFQATSTVEGILKRGYDSFDILKACFPGGSITGCPKIKAMEIIEHLEPTRRGIYTGSFGYISFTGEMDFNILIRTIVSHHNQMHFQVGGGIVADSTPENEYEETMVKAVALNKCLKSAINQKQRLTNV